MSRFKRAVLMGCSVVAFVACGGGNDRSDVPDTHPEDRSGCLNRYDAIRASMQEAQLALLLGAATYQTYDGEAKDGKLLGLGWEAKTYDNNLKCSFLVGMDKQGAYSKGVTGDGFSPRSEVLRTPVGY